MELLPSPTGRSILGPAPYVGLDFRWDGGPFLHYACRHRWLENVPPHLRKCDCHVPDHIQGHLNQFKQCENTCLIQTWLFFGLLAEFYGYNDEPAGNESPKWQHRETIPPNRDREANINTLYTKFVNPPWQFRKGSPSSQKHYISVAILEEAGEGERMLQHLVKKLDGGSNRGRAQVAEYLSYLGECLSFVNAFVNHLDTSRTPFQLSVWASISALGEACTSTLQLLAKQLNLPVILAGIWGTSYLKMDGAVEREMLDQGWCRSDVAYIRESFQGLATRHFLSNMQKPKGFPHDSCSAQMCNAAQIDPETYVLAHDDGCDGCDPVGIDQEKVKCILTEKGSKAFPVLALELGGDGGDRVVKIHVERYDESKPYVALSHVWADGLGNPRENALQLCQIDRLAGLIQGIASQAEPPDAGNQAKRAGQPRYWLWIDTLCCPISLKEKYIAMQRMADVYRKASHVLVIDKSISPFDSEGEGPLKAAENCLRIVGSATWMRRLWTLQEGVLAQSLYFQFRDRAIRLDQESRRLLEFGSTHGGYKTIAQDVALIIYKFRKLRSPDRTSLPSSADADSQLGETKLYLGRIQDIQASLFFRMVSVPSDEPLCMATLLSLDPTAIMDAGHCRQQRMAKMWELVVEKCGGRFAARVIFYNDQPLQLASLAGWRWAPRSLLPPLDKGFGYEMSSIRFNPPDSTADMGEVTYHGLKVSFPGMRIAMRRWAAGTRVWPWSLFTRRFVENQLAFRHHQSGEWFLMSDKMRGDHIDEWTWEEWKKRDADLLAKDKDQPWEGKRPSQPIFNELYNGELCLIQDPIIATKPVQVYLLARLQRVSTKDGALHVHACLPVSVQRLSSRFWPGLDKLQDMARQVGRSDANQKLVHFLAQQENGRDPDPDSEECKRIMQALRAEMQRVAKAELEKDELGYLAPVADRFLGQGKWADVWKVMVGMLPYDLSVESLPDDQVWIVDGPKRDEDCHEACCSKSRRER